MSRRDLQGSPESSQHHALSNQESVAASGVTAFATSVRDSAIPDHSGPPTLVETHQNEFEIDQDPSLEEGKTKNARIEGDRSWGLRGNSPDLEADQDGVRPSPKDEGAPTHPIFSRGVQSYCSAMSSGSLMKACSKMSVEQLNLFVVSLARMSITTVSSMAVSHYLKVEHYFWGSRDVRSSSFIRGGLGYFNIVCTYFSSQYSSSPDSAVISFSTPMTMSVAARIFLKEKYRWQQAAASCVSLLGVVVIARPTLLFGTPEDGDTPNDTDHQTAAQKAASRTAAVTSSMCVVITASAVMIISRKIKERAHASTSVANYAVISVVGSIIASSSQPSDSWHFPRELKMWGLVSSMGSFGFMSQFSSSKAIQMEEATASANFKYTQSSYATALEFIFWHDVPDAVSFAGMVLILTGVYWSARSKAAS